jgi:peroxiredoxin (alkyl hydroperoxide reductase subunit C)
MSDSNSHSNSHVLVSRKAPDFCAAAVLANGEITTDYRLSEVNQNKHVVLFFYPLDFTFVCPSELIALNKRIPEFKKRGVEVIGVSVDSQYTHNAWRNTAIEKGGIGAVQFTLVADVNHSICQAYGVEHPVEGIALRAAFVLDKQGVVQAQIVNNLPLGRNIDELLRVVDALQFHEQHGEVCPAGWSKGDEGMKATPAGVAAYLKENEGRL